MVNFQSLMHLYCMVEFPCFLFKMFLQHKMFPYVEFIGRFISKWIRNCCYTLSQRISIVSIFPWSKCSGIGFSYFYDLETANFFFPFTVVGMALIGSWCNVQSGGTYASFEDASTTGTVVFRGQQDESDSPQTPKSRLGVQERSSSASIEDSALNLAEVSFVLIR